MINLLPVRQQKTLIHAYLGRVGVVALAFVIAIEVVGIIMLLPSYLMVHMQQSTHKQTLVAAEREVTEGGGNTAQAYLEQTAQLQSYAEATTKYPRVTEQIALLRTDTALGIRFGELSLTVEDTNRVVARVQGEAATRTALVDYTAALEADPHIHEVVLPLRDLAANQHIPFTITVEFEPLVQ